MVNNNQDQGLEEKLKVEPRHRKITRTQKSFGPKFLAFMEKSDPLIFQEVVNSSEESLWNEAIKNEINSIVENHTWELVDLPLGCKPFYKWIFKSKMKVDGIVEK